MIKSFEHRFDESVLVIYRQRKRGKISLNELVLWLLTVFLPHFVVIEQVFMMSTSKQYFGVATTKFFSPVEMRNLRFIRMPLFQLAFFNLWISCHFRKKGFLFSMRRRRNLFACKQWVSAASLVKHHVCLFPLKMFLVRVVKLARIAVHTLTDLIQW